jgi:hypothetical protein
MSPRTQYKRFPAPRRRTRAGDERVCAEPGGSGRGALLQATAIGGVSGEERVGAGRFDHQEE